MFHQVNPPQIIKAPRSGITGTGRFCKIRSAGKSRPLLHSVQKASSRASMPAAQPARSVCEPVSRKKHNPPAIQRGWGATAQRVFPIRLPLTFCKITPGDQRFSPLTRTVLSIGDREAWHFSNAENHVQRITSTAWKGRSVPLISMSLFCPWRTTELPNRAMKKNFTHSGRRRGICFMQRLPWD